MRDAGVVILDGDAQEVLGVGFAGVKGFGGGFGPRALGPWGEDTFKRFVHEAVEEALKLESALARLRTPHRIAVLHYAPIRETVEGEPLEIFPFLGSSRLEEPLNRYHVTAVVHGHAHRGQLTGRTTSGVPVHNVSLPLLLRTSPARPFLVLEVPAPEDVSPAPAAPGGRRMTRRRPRRGPRYAAAGATAATAAGEVPVFARSMAHDQAADAVDFYADALAALGRAGVPFLVGGAWAFHRYADIARYTKDFDIFLRPADVPRALAVLDDRGYRTEVPFEHWLAKAWSGDAFMDLIFNSGNGVVPVDDEWFEHAVPADIFGLPLEAAARSRR